MSLLQMTGLCPGRHRVLRFARARCPFPVVMRAENARGGRKGKETSAAELARWACSPGA